MEYFIENSKNSKKQQRQFTQPTEPIIISGIRQNVTIVPFEGRREKIFLTGEEVIKKLEGFFQIEPAKDLARIQFLLKGIGNPQEKLRFIHVGGTNGKGSVSAMLYAIFNRCEYRAGLFTSPHLFAMGERIQVDGVQIPDEAIGRLGEGILTVAEQAESEGLGRPTQLEMSLALALLYFVERRTDIAVIEVGNGGKADPTIAMGVPELAVLTNMDIDNAESGDSNLEALILEKTAIIKAGTKVLLYRQKQEVVDVVSRICKELDVPLIVSKTDSIKKVSQTPHGQKFSVGQKIYQLGIPGEHQRKNVALVLEALQELKHCGFGFDQEGIFAGFSRTVWPGRFERVHIAPDVILDGCHNIQSMEAVLQTLEELYPEKKIIFLVGVLEVTDYKGMIRKVLPVAKKFVTVTPQHKNAMPAKELAKFLKGETSCPVIESASVESGIEIVLELAEPDDVICAWGSLHIVGEIRNTFGLC